MKAKKRNVNKAQRLIILRDLQDEGLLEGRSLQEIADAFDCDLHRSTIMRDLRDLEELRPISKAVRLRLGE